ncbi:hypothetical protein AJ79_06603 [Helicocarpus griseus UAMH5409]|uniref:DNA repair protein Dds20/Mei5 n=1 Tax=Helicocarpus griseus UAMH5409 TaxID=1447875 RepID=A0A2B7XB57_9EURO|nr:hypothetical protein AJ79_06603 [Helicocarpus griseus UAMH5409]
MSYQAAKRRRIDQAASTLSKPFKSPLRKPAPTTSADNGGNLSTPNKQETSLKTSHSNPNPVLSHTTTTTSSTNSPRTPSALKRSTNPSSRQSTTPSSLSSPSAPPELLALQKQHTALTSRLAALRAELDTINQALKVEKSGQDAELEVLIRKWKTASREAAEELFVGAEERVKRMGGVKGWREGMRKAEERRARWDEEEMVANAVNGGEGEDGEEIEGLRAEEVDVDVDVDADVAKEKKEGDGDGDEDESFTMDMMLKSLNIELDLIGFDKDTQQWV